MKFQDLKLTNKTEVIEINTPDYNFTMNNIISMSDKIDLIQITLQKSRVDGIFIPALVYTYFRLGIVYLYSNIQFTEEDRQDEFELYDILSSNEIINKIIENIDDNEYEVLTSLMENTLDLLDRENNNIARIISQLASSLPNQMAEMKEIINNFDPSAYQEVINFAEAANAHRPIV